MSHNRHYIITVAESQEQAEYQIEDELNRYGTEDNYWHICRTVDLDNPTESDKTYLQEELQELNYQLSDEKIAQVKEDIKDYEEQAQDNERHYYWLLSQHYKTLYELVQHKGHEPYTIDNIRDVEDFYGYTFDEYGITNMVYDDPYDEHYYFIEIDMHS